MGPKTKRRVQEWLSVVSVTNFDHIRSANGSSPNFVSIINPFQPSIAFHIETCHLFCRAKQKTGFYMKYNTGLKWVKRI